MRTGFVGLQRRRLVEEDAAEVVAVGEDVRLARQVRAAAVHKVHARQAAGLRDLLQPQVLLRTQHGRNFCYFYMRRSQH